MRNHLEKLTESKAILAILAIIVMVFGLFATDFTSDQADAADMEGVEVEIEGYSPSGTVSWSSNGGETWN